MVADGKKLSDSVNGLGRSFERYGAPSAILSICFVFFGWWMIWIYKPDHDQDRIDRKLSAEAAMKVATAVEDQTDLMRDIKGGLSDIKVGTEESHRLQKETQTLIREQNTSLGSVLLEIKKTNQALRGPIKTSPMPPYDDGQN